MTPDEKRGYNRALKDRQNRDQRISRREVDAPVTDVTETGSGSIPSADPYRVRLPGGVPSAAQYTSTVRKQVYLALLASLIVNFAAHIDPNKTDSITHSVRTTSKQVNLIGFGILFIMLSFAADFDSTADLARAFAFLILVATLLNSGGAAFTNIGTLAGRGNKTLVPVLPPDHPTPGEINP